MTKSKSKAICVLGMHRSGTSVTAHVVHLLGGWLGEDEDLIAAEPANLTGYWERGDINSLHERMLRALHRAWDTSFPLPQDWHRSSDRFWIPRVRQIFDL